MRRVSLLIATAVAAGTIVVGAAGSAGACGARVSRASVFKQMRSGGLEVISLRTLNLDVETPKVAAIGTTATIKVTVTRPAKEDPLHQGIPMERPYVEPAPGVVVGVGLFIGDVFLPGAAISDENGIAKVKIFLERYAPGDTWVDVSVYGWKIVHDSPCARVQEDGYTPLGKAFRTS